MVEIKNRSTCKCFIPIVLAILNSFIGQTKLISSKYHATKKILKKINHYFKKES
jgi:hypothetical protein